MTRLPSFSCEFCAVELAAVAAVPPAAAESFARLAESAPKGYAKISQMHEADIVYEGGRPKLANQRLIIDSRDLPFRCTMETQNFRPPDEQELTFTFYYE